MLDEFVEHATGSSAPSRNVSSLQYEGFEPDMNETDNVDVAQAEITPTTPVAPIFDLGRVQCAINAPLVSMVVCSDVLLMGLSSNVLILIELSHATQVDRIPVGGGKPFTLYKLFMDPSGRHIVITSTQGDNWYMYRAWKKAKPLTRQKMIIESIAWNKAALLSPSHPTSSREILIGTRNGTIYEALLDAQEDLFKSHDRYVTEVMTLPDKHPITGIKVDFFPPSDPRKALVVVTTPSRIYQFVGFPKRADERNAVLFTSFFSAYRDVAPRILELPGNTTHSELHYYTPNSDQALSLPTSLVWMTAHGIYHGTLNFDTNGDDFIDGADVIPYPLISSSDSTPVSIALTEFHLVMLYPDRIAAVSILNRKLAYQEVLPLKANERVKGLTADPVRKTFWVYTDQSLFELLVGNEDRDVWKVYLQNGQFDVALRYAKTAGQRNHILSAQANTFFANGDYFKAAQSYSQCSVNFEEVALKFLDVNERDTLRSYLISRLERTKKSDRTQRMMLATWLVEFYLSKCNELDDAIASESLLHDVNNLLEERNILQADLRQFFETYKNDLDRKTVYELIQGHGRTDMYLHYANAVGDYDRVIEHWILEEDWSNAIGVINRQSDLELYYRFGPVLMRHAPKDTVESWFKQSALDPHRLIPALLQQQHAPRDPLSPNQAIRYLNHLVFEQQNVSSTIHNLLVTFYVSPSPSSFGGDEAGLLRFLSTAPSDPLTGKPYYDLDYALRICKQTGRTQPCVHIYAKMGLWENSVDLALEKGDLELAKVNADMPEDDQPLRKKLWLKIAKYVVQDKKDIKTAMQFLESTDLLKIEDILPFFPDFVVIDDFKEEIAQALEGYSAHIDSLKHEMDEATRTAESIKQDMAVLRNRFVTIDSGEQCSSCSHALLTRQFYVFPCRHTFHADCLIGLAKEYLPAHSLRRMLALQNELAPVPVNTGSTGRQRTLLSSNFNPLQNGTRALGRNILSAGDKLRDLIVPDALAAVVSTPAWIPGIGGGRRSGIEVDGGKKTEKLRAELEDLLASSCPLCESVIVGLDKAFVKEGEIDNNWTL